MDRLGKKCLIASGGMHLLLCTVLIFGSAFLLPRDKAPAIPPLRAIPTKLIDDALSGGGGDPKLPHTDDRQKGQTQTPQPVQPPPMEKPRPQPPPVTRADVKPKTESKRVETPKPVKPPKDIVKDIPKPRPDTNPKTAKTLPLDLKPVTRPKVDKQKQEAEAEAKQAEARAAEARAADAREAAAAQKRLAQALAKANERLREGFAQGTKVVIDGPGGEAYADYTQFVKSIYEDAWSVTDDLTDEDSTAKVSVTIARSGRVIAARIERRSGNATLDKSVQRALDKVTFVRPFPENTSDEQRTFLINFNLKAKRLLG